MDKIMKHLDLVIEYLANPSGVVSYRMFEESLACFLINGTIEDWGHLRKRTITLDQAATRRTMMVLEQIMHQELCLEDQILHSMILEGRHRLAITAPELGAIHYQERWNCDVQPIDCQSLRARLDEMRRGEPSKNGF